MTTKQIEFSLLRLTAWPDLPRLPSAYVVDTSRVCALLCWRATAGLLVPALLGLSKERGLEILQMLHDQGCLNISEDGREASSSPAPGEPEGSGDDSGVGQPSSFIGKIWQRLAG